jgi:hypothetical protein
MTVVEAPHRQSPNHKRELRERVQHLVRERMGKGIICSRCGCSFSNFDDKCAANLGEGCPGANAIGLVQSRAERDVGLA